METVPPAGRVRVSAIVPSYNRRELLRECLGSMLSQTRPPDEIVVVDDGSTDGTQQMVAGEFPAVRCVRIDNGGVVVARIKGIEQARHDWIALCDSDDLWVPDYLAARLDLLRRHPGCLYSFGNFRLQEAGCVAPATKFDDAPAGYWERFGRQASNDAIVAHEPPYGALLRFQPVFPSTVVMHRSFYERTGGFDARLTRTMSEDFEFTLRCGELAPLLADRAAHVLIRRHSSNASGDLGSMLVGDVGILRFARAHHRSARRHAAVIADEISGRSRQAAEVFFACGDLDRFRALASDVALRHSSLKWFLKRAVASVPAPLARALVRRLTYKGQTEQAIANLRLPS